MQKTWADLRAIRPHGRLQGFTTAKISANPPAWLFALWFVLMAFMLCR